MFIRKIIDMYYKDIIESIENVMKRFKGVNFVKYTGEDLINQQHNENTLQCYIDDVTMSQYNLTTNINKIELQVYILGFAENTPEAILNVQDQCYNAAVNLLAYYDNMPEFQGILKLYDWSILTLSRYTSQANAGVKVSVILDVVSPINLCAVGDWFNEDPYPEEKDKEIDLQEITLKRGFDCR